MVVGALSKGPMRFNALMRLIGGVSHRMLTLTLRGLEEDGLVTRTVYPTVPPKVEYELTKIGASLIGPLRTLSAWAQKNHPAIEAARASRAAASRLTTDRTPGSPGRTLREILGPPESQSRERASFSDMPSRESGTRARSTGTTLTPTVRMCSSPPRRTPRRGLTSP
jgi:DNA-binding HxlR family transcriptional regulator